MALNLPRRTVNVVVCTYSYVASTSSVHRVVLDACSRTGTQNDPSEISRRMARSLQTSTPAESVDIAVGIRAHSEAVFSFSLPSLLPFLRHFTCSFPFDVAHHGSIWVPLGVLRRCFPVWKPPSKV